MIHSNERKLCLSGWLKHNYQKEYDTPLKLQKFLLFYEAFSKVSGEKTDFSHLRGYERGPVFSDVWGDYTKEREAFNRAVEASFSAAGQDIDENRARKSAFVVRILSEQELSDFTHHLNLWKCKEERIQRGEYQVDLEESDFNEDDYELIHTLELMYPDDMVKHSVVKDIGEHHFIIPEGEIPRLTEEHIIALHTMCEKEELHNPIYVDIDEGGRLIVD